jgi:mTERF domain-containing protein
MFKFNSWRHKTLIYYLKGLTFSQSPNPNPLFQQYPSLFSLHFCTNTSDDSTPLPVSYLINNFGFSPKSASKLCSTYNVRFKTAQKPDSIRNFFRNHGFSDTQLHHIIAKLPWLLSCNPSKRVLPKFQFFLSKGASTSYIVDIVCKNPVVLSASLKNRIVPAYELVYRYLQSDKDTIALLNYNPIIFGSSNVVHNIKVLTEIGVTDSNIARLLRTCTKLFYRKDLHELVEELKDLGFDPPRSIFSIALMAKSSVSKTLWKEKVDAFKKWGWSDEDVIQAFRKQPHCMLTSIDKINLVMSYWVNQLGWDAMDIAKVPRVFGASLEQRIIPRAPVVQYLSKKGLLKKEASLTSPFVVKEEIFLDMYINRFKEESSYLLKLYEEKLKLAQTKEKTAMI